MIDETSKLVGCKASADESSTSEKERNRQSDYEGCGEILFASDTQRQSFSMRKSGRVQE